MTLVPQDIRTPLWAIREAVLVRLRSIRSRIQAASTNQTLTLRWTNLVQNDPAGERYYLTSGHPCCHLRRRKQRDSLSRPPIILIV